MKKPGLSRWIPMKTDKMVVALAGQPNCGKSTVFNALTGARQHVANYPGVTVEKMTGWYWYGDVRVTVVDLPGTYSLTSYSPEERVTRDFILHQNPSVVVNTMDASNLKRCLYLTFQLLEMENPLILNLNMMDVAQHRGLTIDVKSLSRNLGVPVVPTAITKGKGKADLQAAILETAEKGMPGTPARVDYREMTDYITSVQERITAVTDLGDRYPLRWLAIKLMEGDEAVRDMVREKPGTTPDCWLWWIRSGRISRPPQELPRTCMWPIAATGPPKGSPGHVSPGPPKPEKAFPTVLMPWSATR